MASLSNRILFFKLVLAGLVICSLCSQSGSAASFLYQADQARSAGNYDQALDFYRQAINGDPKSSRDACEHMSDLLTKLQRYNESAQIVQQLYTSTGDNKYRRELASIYRRSGNFYQAQSVYQDMIAANPKDGEALISLGECLEATGNFDAARDQYAKAAGVAGFEDRGRGKLARISDQHSGSTEAAVDQDLVLGKWPVNRRNLKVAIADGAGVTGFRPNFREAVSSAVEAWNAAGGRLIHMEIVDGDPAASDIEVAWKEMIPGALGIAQPIYSAPRVLRHVKITLTTNVDTYGHTLPPEGTATQALHEGHVRMLQEVAKHEFGHALGLLHSPNSSDVMCSGGFNINWHETLTTRPLSNVDVERLRSTYDDATGMVNSSTDNSEKGTSKSGEPVLKRAVVAVRKKDGELPAEPSIESPAELADLTTTSMRAAIFDLGRGKFDACQERLTRILVRVPGNAQAHYLSAVVAVNLHHYDEAVRQYKMVLKLQPTGKLADLASDGLSKIKK